MNVKVVNLQGSITVSAVDKLAGEIRESLKKAQTIMLSLSHATDIDLAGVQLLYAARRYAEKKKKELHFTGSVPEPVARKLLLSGFTEELILEGSALEERLQGFSRGADEDA